MPSYKVRVTKDYTVFCSGHFITYGGDQCEAAHGHNYRAAASLEGELNADDYVFDFVTLKKMLRAICDRLDHKMLLPLHNRHFELNYDDARVQLRHKHKEYVFPREDCQLLPLPNTTAEKLAEWIAGELEAELKRRGTRGLRTLEVEVEETVGQCAYYRKDLNREDAENAK